MKKINLLSYSLLLLGIITTGSFSNRLQAQVLMDAHSSGGGSGTWYITTTHPNELILIAACGYGYAGGLSTSPGTIKVNGNNAAYITEGLESTSYSISWTASIWAYQAPAAGTYTCVCSEANILNPFYENFATSVYQTGYPVTLSDVIIGGNVHNHSDSGTASITTTLANSFIFGTSEINDNGGTGTVKWNGGGIVDLNHQYINNGVDGDQAGVTEAVAGIYHIKVIDSLASNPYSTMALVAVQPGNSLCTLGTSVFITNNILCYGGMNASAMAYPMGGTTPYTYLWSPGGSTSSTISGLSAGNYTITVTDHSGCTTTNTTTITQPNPMIVTVTQYGSSCAGACAIASISGGTSPYTYYWYPGNNTSDTTCGLSAGTYTVTGTDQYGCTGTGSVTIVLSSTLNATSTMTTNSSCTIPNGTATAIPSGGVSPYTYYWMPSGQTTQTAVGLSGGWDTCIVRDNAGCSYITQVYVTGAVGIVLPAIIIGVNNTGCITANGWADATPNAGNPPFTYLWSPGGQTTAIASGLSAGSYTCVVQDNSGCSATTTTTISTASSTLSLSFSSIPDSSSCQGEASVSVSGGTAPYTYLWTPGGQTSSIISDLCVGVYCVTVTDNTGCTAMGCETVHGAGNCGGNIPGICYVTSDTNSVHNILYWDRTGIDTNAIDSFLIYRGVTTFIYQKIAQVSIHAHTMYVDVTSNPTVESYYYKLGLADTCHTYPISNYHQSILLQASWALGNTMNLIWNYYQGAIVNYYRILRDDSGTGNWHVIDSVPGGDNAYTDYNAPVNANLRYRLSLNWDVSCTPYLTIRSHGRLMNTQPTIAAYSNITNDQYTGINGIGLLYSDVDVFPNPTSTMLNVEISGISSHTDFYLTDMLGRNVFTDKDKAVNPGFIETINMESLQSGVYFLTIESNGQRLVKKVTRL